MDRAPAHFFRFSEKIYQLCFAKKASIQAFKYQCCPYIETSRNQSIDLLCKLIDWFLYEGNTGT